MMTKATAWVLLASAALLALCANAGAQNTASARPNILLIVSDDQRPDTIAALGNSEIRTPNLDALVRSGLSFTRAVCANPICTPSRAEILTGCSGFRNGVLDFGRKIGDDIPRWPAAMREAGYHTWYVGKWHNNGRPRDHGYEESLGLYSSGGGRRKLNEPVDFKGTPVTGYRGWVFQTDDRRVFPERGVGLTADISTRFADAAIEFIQRERDAPFFLHVNFTAPHDPLLLPLGYEQAYDPAKISLPKNFLPEHPFDHGNLRGRDEKLLPWPRRKQQVLEVLAAYYTVISHMDEQIGRVLAALEKIEKRGRNSNTIVIFTSDHGLGVGSHGLRGKQSMYEHTVNVPLVIRGPGVPRNHRSDAQVYLRDLFPTVCELAGVKSPENIDGKSLAPVIRGEKVAVRDHVFCYFRDKQRMVRDDRFKLILYPAVEIEQLFDLWVDPFEMRNLIDDPTHAKTVERMRALLRKVREEAGDATLAK